MGAPPRAQDRRSSIDLLPAIATPHVQAALLALTERKRTEADIRDELNNHLLALGIDPVSRSAFSRHKLRLMVQGGTIMRAREVAAVFAEKLATTPGADIGLLLGETMKSMIYEAIADMAAMDEMPSAKEMSAMTLSLMRIEAARHMAVKGAVQRKEHLVERVDEAITEATKERGLSSDVVAQLRRDVLGIVKQSVADKPE